ncbi:MAG: response regulator [Spirochaetes bacterium]|nr:response regulator [Spirochaetota bacterium]
MSEAAGARPTILIVDDDEQVRALMQTLLTALGYRPEVAEDGAEALEKVAASPPDLILMDATMPRVGGLEAVRRLKGSETTRIIPIIMVTGLHDMDTKVKALEAGVDDFLGKPWEQIELKARIASLLRVKAGNDQSRRYQKDLEAEVEKRTRQLEGALTRQRTLSLEAIYRLSRASEFRDEDTGAHLRRMSRYSAEVARRMDLPKRTIEAILYASPMHDVGKIGIPDQILLKPGKLEPHEMQIMRLHTTIGSQILHGSTTDFLKLGEVIALTHHEKWDGSGYPHGLAGAKIPLAGSITAIADVFDALTTKRPYKDPFPVEKALAIVREGREKHFHPEVVDAFFSITDEILRIRRDNGDEGESALFRLTRMAENPTVPLR